MKLLGEMLGDCNNIDCNWMTDMTLIATDYPITLTAFNGSNDTNDKDSLWFIK